MKVILKALIVFLLAAAAAPFLFSGEAQGLLEKFTADGRSYALEAVFSPGQADLLLRGRTEKVLSAGMKGENILLGVRRGSGNFYVFWLNYRHKATRLAYYDHARRRSRLLPLAGFAAIGLPEIIEEKGGLRALLFLADRSGNDDLFYYEPECDALTRLTDTPFSEKEFSWRQESGKLEIEARSLKAMRRYRFDPGLRQNTLLGENNFRGRQRRASAAPAPEYYNTYIGFGDSITWGQIESVQRLDLCYLTQMRDLFLPLNYGPSGFVNLGVPGDGTYAAARRVDRDLNGNSAFYFLLMIGVNDVRDQDGFSLASRLEDVEYIIAAAQARSMRVIVSTLTPRKDIYAGYNWYWDNLYAFSSGIRQLAARMGTASVDALGAFMNTDPPDGWKTLLENIIPSVSKGNHPNAAGHALIASLFADALVKFPPQAPQNIQVIDPRNTLRRTASWNPNYESDFSHFQVEFGFQPQSLRQSLSTAASYCTFTLFPFLPQLVFRVQTVDRGGRGSAFSTLDTAAAATAPRPGREK